MHMRYLFISQSDTVFFLSIHPISKFINGVMNIVAIWFLSSCQPLQACASTVKYFPPILRQYLAIIPNDAILYHTLEYGHYLSIWPYLDTAVQPSGSTKLYNIILSKLSTLQKPLVAPFIPTPVINPIETSTWTRKLNWMNELKTMDNRILFKTKIKNILNSHKGSFVAGSLVLQTELK